MPRPPRLNIEGASYHVMARGNRKQLIFESDRDRTRFLEILNEAVERYAVLLLGHCLMGNHFHLVITTPRGNVSAFMRQVDGTFTQYSNWCHQRVGHLLQGPFKAVLIEDDIHLLTALGYVLMNPVDAGFCASPSDWTWSSYCATVGLTPAPPTLSIEWLDRLFPASSRQESQRGFAEFMHSTRSCQSYFELSTPAVGSEVFRQRIRSYIGDQLFAARVPRSYKSVFRPTLEELFSDTASRTERRLMIERAHVVHGYRLGEIARSLGMHPASVSRILCSVRREGRERVEQRLKNGT
jgi:REP element-mobilizing transposase RayT